MADSSLQGGNEAKPKSVLLLVLLVVLCHATQASIRMASGAKGGGPNVSVADLLLALAFLLWIVHRLRTGRVRVGGIGLPILGTIWLGLSLVHVLRSGDRAQIKTGIVNVIQFFEYFVVAYLLFVDFLNTPRVRIWAVRLLGLALVVSVIAAVAQYALGVSVVKIRGAWFEDRNTYGLFLALALPLLFGVSSFNNGSARRLAFWLVLAAALCTCLSGGAYVAVCAGILTVAALKTPSRFLWMAFLLLVICFAIVPRLPRNNGAVLADSVLLYRTKDPYGIYRGDIDRVSQTLADKQGRVASNAMDNKPVDLADIPNEKDYSWRWSQRYKEWQAALNMISERPVLGVGAGLYQRNVDAEYGDMPKYPVNLLESDTLSMYAVWAASAGIPFLIILFGMALRGGVSAAKSLASAEAKSEKGIAAGVIGALVAISIAAVFSDPLVRGVGITLALVLALAKAVENSASSEGAR